ncbi:cytochrome c maturation protein CcmE [Candidatus Photodesmus anomalopis]|uniref:Cytochrome c-type biogenesis protein CcmE n=1 Tax=Candidatus Photodesmus katoptron Akat1 TaxID=1236703 RepID=S3DKP4_9GAMM|nr:cytochrome c maturation protein CcmE [Candidatus Photodesmus katoptron]EPE37694.1 cytochrome c-type biogenesis protein CcmE [Candidatus Photodesmus katoptron Akat1]
MNSKYKKRLGLIFLMFTSIAGMISLVLYALKENIDFFYTPTELIYGKGHSLAKPKIGQRLRVGGTVLNGSVNRDLNSLQVSFRLHDMNSSIVVLYDGILPDLFREGQGIVAQGFLLDSSTFKASQVLAKHDEEYMPFGEAESMKKTHKPIQHSDKQVSMK